MDLNLAGRTAVISGGSMGIGKAIAKGLAAEGVNLVLLARGQEALDETAKEIGGAHDVDILTVSTDIRDAESVNAMAAAAAERFGTIHILVNSAGHRMRRFDRQLLWDDDDWTSDIDHKTVGMLRVIRALYPHFAKDGTGRIINISGTAGLIVWEGAMTHGINNSAMIHITRYLARDLAEDKINVNAVVPGLVATEWRQGWASMVSEKQGISRDEFLANYTRDKGILAGRWASMEEIADPVVFLASDRAQYINGESLAVDAGQSTNPR